MEVSHTHPCTQLAIRQFRCRPRFGPSHEYLKEKKHERARMHTNAHIHIKTMKHYLCNLITETDTLLLYKPTEAHGPIAPIPRVHTKERDTGDRYATKHHTGTSRRIH